MTTRIAVAQLTSKAVKWDNLLQVARCAGWAREASCRMLFLPECFGFLGNTAAETLAAAEESSLTAGTNTDELNQLLRSAVLQSGTESDHDFKDFSAPPPNQQVSLIDGLRTIARTSGLWISAGGVHVATESRDKVYNTHLMFDDSGSIKAHYRKIHLFDVSIPSENVDLKESRTTECGTKLVVCPDTPIGCLGLSICYDLRFPEMYVRLVEMGATTILVPSAFTVPTGKAHWHTLLKARAIETQCYVVAAAQYGRHNDKRESYGHSLVVDPWGSVVKDAGGVDTSDGSLADTPCIVTCEIDLDRVDTTRKRMPIQAHRKSALEVMD